MPFLKNDQFIFLYKPRHKIHDEKYYKSQPCGSPPGSFFSGGTAALQFAAEEEGVVCLAVSDPETLESQGGESLPFKG